MMLYGWASGELEIRRGGGGRGARLSGSFPYGKTATLSDGGRGGGRPRKERFKSRAFGHSVRSKTQEIHLLVGHSFDRPLASKFGGSLVLEDSDEALSFVAEIPEEMENVSHVRDALAMLSAGMVGGISVGFRLPPPRTVENAETIENEDPELGTAIIRTVNQAILYELSLVTRPAYDQTQVEARSWDLTRQAVQSTARPQYRWRL